MASHPPWREPCTGEAWGPCCPCLGSAGLLVTQGTAAISTVEFYLSFATSKQSTVVLVITVPQQAPSSLLQRLLN